MRVTEGTNYRNLLRDIAQVQERMENAQIQISSGKRIHVPSDDPSMAADIIRISGEKSEAAQYERNLIFGRTKLDLADTVLDNVERMVERVRSLGQLALSNPESGAMYRTEVEGLRDQIILAANTIHAGRFLFGGSMTTEPPYLKASDGTVTYQGDSDTPTLQVGRNATLPTQLPGSEIFNAAIDILETLSSPVTALDAEDKPGIDAAVGNLERFADTLSTSRSRIGGYVNIAAHIESEMANAGLARERNLNEAQAADLAKAITEFQLSENALQATMAVGARISQINLLDYL